MTRKQVIEGFNYQTFEKFPEACICLICTFVAREAHQVRCCGKIYCKQCLNELKLKSDNFKCPNCRSSLQGNNKYFPDLNMDRMIHNLVIYCSNKDKGCQWEGGLKDFEKDHLPKCPYQIIGCSYKCGVKLQRQELDNHLKEKCLRRPFACPFCKSMGIYKNITGDHTKTCPDYLLKCPNSDCDKKIKRSQMTQHCNECSKEIVSCHHSSLGCITRIKREELLSHDKECMSSHLDFAIKEIHELRQEIHKLRAQTFKIPVIKMQNYSRNKEWISPSFYVSADSYKMALKVSSYKEGWEWWYTEYLSCELALLPGEYDDTLDWPFQGEFIVALLNPKENRYHRRMLINFNKDTPDKCKNRVKSPNEYGEWHGKKKFMDLQGYLDNDTLYFRISVEINTKNNRSWLI